MWGEDEGSTHALFPILEALLNVEDHLSYQKVVVLSGFTSLMLCDVLANGAFANLDFPL